MKVLTLYVILISFLISCIENYVKRNKTLLSQSSQTIYLDVSDSLKPETNNILNVKNHGAVGNGITDDTKAFHAVLHKVKQGQKIFIPTGKYIISEPLLIEKNNIIIEGEGKDSKLIFNNKQDYYKKYGTRVGLLNIKANNININNIFLDQNFRGSNRADGSKPLIGGIIIGGKYLGKASSVKNIIINSVYVYDYYGDAISVFSSRVENFNVLNCHLTSSYIAGDWIKAGHKGEQGISVASGRNINIERNIILGALDDAIAVHRNNDSVRIIQNRITTTGGRILVNGVKNGIVKDNVIEYIQDGGCAMQVSFDAYAKYISPNENVWIENNRVTIKPGVKIKAAIQIFGGGKNIYVKNNKLNGNGMGVGILVLDRTSRRLKQKVYSENVFLEDNLIENFDKKQINTSNNNNK